MYLTKFISIILTATGAIVAAAPFQLEERQSSICAEALSELSQTAAYYESVGANLEGVAAAGFQSDLTKFNEAATSISEACQDMDQVSATEA
ncbi:hypothetical protein N7510_008431 [Penicillium lagena]|uniref:uncharacterized protein n=1 Tax=Penicillium lagena TaxID=94218 RepID=UPI002540317E|nr:uncharacterized protein N7510_008431 [Penicillium lagena]KAJ5605650.1 hypothetical protein N7510_008431 [Penicillium lagena]